MPKKKANTRRKKRRHVLDVKASSSQVRKHRIRMSVSALITMVVILGSAYGLWRGGYWAAQHFVYQNKNLSIKHFDVRTDGVIDTRYLRRLSGVRRGDNLFATDLHGIKSNLENHGMIKSVAIQRKLPDTLRMQVYERVPMARIRVAERGATGRYSYRTFALDMDGVLMTLNTNIVRGETALAWKKLPLLTTTNYNGVFSAPDLRNPQLKAALTLISRFDAASIRDYLQITRVDIDDEFVLRVSVSNGATVDVLNQDFDRQLTRWKSIHQTLAGRRESYQWIDLSVTNHVPVRLTNPHSPTNQPNSLREY
jgi:cell division septal protein FtsQ